MSIERDPNIIFDPEGTLRATTRWVSHHEEGLAEWLKNVRRIYQIDRANVSDDHRVVAVLMCDASGKDPARIGLLDVGGATADDVSRWSQWQIDFRKPERGLAIEVNKIISHPVFREWLSNSNKPTKFYGAGHFWGVAPGTPPRVIRDRLKHIEVTLETAKEYLDRNGTDVLCGDRDQVVAEGADIERCIEFHDVFESALLPRTEGASIGGLNEKPAAWNSGHFVLATSYSRTAYRRTTIGAAAFHCRVRNGNGSAYRR
jgi:hypothetical protein